MFCRIIAKIISFLSGNFDSLFLRYIDFFILFVTRQDDISLDLMLLLRQMKAISFASFLMRAIIVVHFSHRKRYQHSGKYILLNKSNLLYCQFLNYIVPRMCKRNGSFKLLFSEVRSIALIGFVPNVLNVFDFIGSQDGKTLSYSSLYSDDSVVN